MAMDEKSEYNLKRLGFPPRAKNDPTGAMNQAIVEYYRCPENVAAFQLAGKVSADPGYFRFGPETICYGKSSCAFRSIPTTSSRISATNATRTTAMKAKVPSAPRLWSGTSTIDCAPICRFPFGNTFRKRA